MLRFYFDEHMPRAVERGLFARGYEVIMAVDVKMSGKSDPEQLQYATDHIAVTVTLDREFAGLTLGGVDHIGLICWTGLDSDIGGLVRKLSEFADKHTPEEVAGQVFWMR